MLKPATIRQLDKLTTELESRGAEVHANVQRLDTQVELAFTLGSGQMASRYSNFVSPSPGNQLEKAPDGGLFVPPPAQEEPDFLALYILGRN